MNNYQQQQQIADTCVRTGIPRLDFPECTPESTICSRFNQVAKRFPQNIALKSREHCFSYRELDYRTDAFARFLRSLCLSRNERIGLLFEHDVLSVVAGLAVLKAEAIRVELDIGFPWLRLQEILDQCKVKHIVTSSKNLQLATEIAGKSTTIINVDDFDFQSNEGGLQSSSVGDTPVTISYSSGSTGKPKKMVRDNLNELNAAMRVTRSIGLDSQDRMLFTRCSVAIPLHALLQGASYYPADLKFNNNLIDLADWIRDEHITVFRTPVSTFRALTRTLPGSFSFPDLRLVVLQGEQVYRSDIELFRTHFYTSCILVSSLGVS